MRMAVLFSRWVCCCLSLDAESAGWTVCCSDQRLQDARSEEQKREAAAKRIEGMKRATEARIQEEKRCDAERQSGVGWCCVPDCFV